MGIANFYDRRILPHVIDKACGIGPIQKERSRLVPRAYGRVLEIGVGTGHNLEFYARNQVETLLALDPAEQMNPLAQRRAEDAGIGVELINLPAETIPLDDNSIDSVVMTFTLCTIPDGPMALAEIRRVLKPDGLMVFVEHGRAPDESVRTWQRRLNPIWGALGGGCHLDRDVPTLLTGAGFELPEFNQYYIDGPKATRFSSYLYMGEAAPA